MKQQELSPRVRFDRPTTLTAAPPSRRAWNVKQPVSVNLEPRQKKIHTIVVPLDGIAYAEHALPQALAIARRSGATLRLIQAYSRLDAIDPWLMSSAPLGIKAAEHEKRAYLARVVKRISRVDFVPVETFLLDGTNIVDSLASGSTGADLMVLASRRRNLVSRLWWNSTFDGLRRQLSIPVHLAQGYSSPVDLTADPLPRHILVPLDGSVLSQSILEHVARLTRLEGAALTLLNVQNDEWTRGFFEHTNPRHYLLSAVRSLKSTISSVEAHIITTDRSPAEAIATFAEQANVDLIALASRADHGLSRLMRGSVADTLVRQTKLPIAVRNFDDRPLRPELTTVA